MSENKPGHELTRAERMERHNRHEAYADVVTEMFTRGETFVAISKATGIPRTTVMHMCKRLSAEYVRERYGDHTAVLGRELNILDQLTRTNLARAKQGDKASADIVLNSHIRRSRLLGLDAAVKAEVTVRTAQDIEIERLVSLMRDGEPPESAYSGPGTAGGSLGPADGAESPGRDSTASAAGGVA
jgi:hypothetical protein